MPGSQVDVLDGVREGRLERSDRRTVAWIECGESDGVPLLRIPGTPSSRFAIRADRQPWVDRNLRVLITERPGFGASTRLPGRGFVEHADDLLRLLDAAGIARTHVIGGSGGAPYVLAFCERHPARVSSASVVVGNAPLNEAELETMIPLNLEAFRHARAGDVEGLRRALQKIREAILADPIASVRGTMATAPEADRAIMTDPLWQAAYAVNAIEAIRRGVDGWVDEMLAASRRWDDIHPERISTSITWWHSDADRNCPISAARRLVERLPEATFLTWTNAGHLEPYVREPVILDELLARA